MGKRSKIVKSIKEWLSFRDEHHVTCNNTLDAQSAPPSSLIDTQSTQPASLTNAQSTQFSSLIDVVEPVKEWLSICDERHATCNNTSDIQSTRPSWLIDVLEQCIVPGDAEGGYIALSYTWLNVEGLSHNAEPMQLLSSNLHSMRMPNTLRKEASNLPTVIKDAIELTSLLGKRWLWIDRLCIVQDGAQKEAECMHMDHIYAGAYMTIAAARQGRIFSRYPSGEWRSRKASFHSRCPTRGILGDKIRYNYHMLNGSKWAKRAWTYQEQILSKRVVFFTDSEIFWQCETATWDCTGLSPHQDEQATVSVAPCSTLLKNFATPAYPDFELYTDLICPYNGRELSYQEDGLSACLGILNTLEPAFPGGFTFGLPRLYLDHALLWQPLKLPYAYSNSKIQAREGFPPDGCTPMPGPSTRRPSLPSWAWCGWQCFIDPTSLLKAFSPGKLSDERYERNPQTLQSLASWKPLHAEDKYGKILTQGSKASSSQSNLITARVPIACFFSAATLALRVSPGYSRAQSAFMSAHANTALEEKPLEDLPKVVVIQDHSGLFSGLLRVTGNLIREECQEIKLFAVSRGCANGRNLNESFEEKVFHRSRYHDGRRFHPLYDGHERWIGKTPENVLGGDERYCVIAEGAYKPSFDPPLTAYNDEAIYEFMNVLWVEDGEDGVSYRAGCGYVLRDRWEAMTPIETEVILG